MSNGMHMDTPSPTTVQLPISFGYFLPPVCYCTSSLLLSRLEYLNSLFFLWLHVIVVKLRFNFISADKLSLVKGNAAEHREQEMWFR